MLVATFERVMVRSGRFLGIDAERKPGSPSVSIARVKVSAVLMVPYKSSIETARKSG